MSWRWLYTVPLRLRSLFRRSQVESEFDEEFRFHLERQVEYEVARGRSPQEARYIALRRIGGLEQRKEECRDMRHVKVIDNVMRDVPYAMRMLVRGPGFTLAALLALSLGIGANTGMYSIVRAVILRLARTRLLAAPRRADACSRSSVGACGPEGRRWARSLR